MRWSIKGSYSMPIHGQLRKPLKHFISYAILQLELEPVSYHRVHIATLIILLGQHPLNSMNANVHLKDIQQEIFPKFLPIGPNFTVKLNLEENVKKNVLIIIFHPFRED